MTASSSELSEDMGDPERAMGDIAIVHVTFADDAEANRIATAMIEARLAACANIDAPCRSIYRWKGAIEQTNEVRATFKTTMALAPELAGRIAALHGYDLPAIEIMPAAVDRRLLDWVIAETGPENATVS